MFVLATCSFAIFVNVGFGRSIAMAHAVCGTYCSDRRVYVPYHVFCSALDRTGRGGGAQAAALGWGGGRRGGRGGGPMSHSAPPRTSNRPVSLV